jgi:hypothetical protein
MLFEKKPEGYFSPSASVAMVNDDDTRKLSGATAGSQSRTTSDAAASKSRASPNLGARDIEKAVKSKSVARRRREKWFGNDTENLYSPLVEFIAVRAVHCFGDFKLINPSQTFVLILIIVSANLAVSARAERGVDMDVFGCRLLAALVL